MAKQLIKQPISHYYANSFYPQLTDDIPEEPLYYPFWDEKDASIRWVGWTASKAAPDFVKFGGTPWSSAQSFGWDNLTGQDHLKTIGVLCGESALGSNYFIPAGKKLVFEVQVGNFQNDDAFNASSVAQVFALESECIISDFTYNSPPSGREILKTTLDFQTASGPETKQRVNWKYTYECDEDTYGLYLKASATGGSAPNDPAHSHLELAIASGVSGNNLTPYPYITNDRLLFEK